MALNAVTNIRRRQVGTFAGTYIDLNDVQEFHYPALSRIPNQALAGSPNNSAKFIRVPP